MKYLLLAAIATLAGCATPQPYNPVAAQCEYESAIATAGIRNPITAGIQQGQIFNQCMSIRGR